MDQQLAIEWVEIDRLFGNPANPRHNDQAVEPVAASLRRFGWQQPIVAKPSGEVVAGNTRLKAAKALGMTSVPVVRFAGTDLDATAFGIADNRTGEIAEWDEDALRELLSVLQAEDALEGVGYSDEEIAALLAGCEEPTSDLEDAGPEAPPENPTSRLGDLWLLGEHRLLCGDSTSPKDMARLMAGETAMLLATDAPYLVDYDGTNHPAECQGTRTFTQLADTYFYAPPGWGWDGQDLVGWPLGPVKGDPRGAEPPCGGGSRAKPAARQAEAERGAPGGEAPREVGVQGEETHNVWRVTSPAPPGPAGGSCDP